MLICLIFLNLLPAVKCFPLNNCFTNDLDIRIASLSKKEDFLIIKSLLKYLAEWTPNHERTIRISIEKTCDLQTRPEFININNISLENSTVCYRGILPGNDKEPITISNNDIDECIDYFNRNSLPGAIRLVIWFVECTPQNCSHQLDQSINTTKLSSSDLNVFFVNFNRWNLHKFTGQLHLNNVLQTGEVSLLYKKNFNFFQEQLNKLGLKLCGRCSSGWVHYQSQSKPFVQSCYHLGVQKNLSRYEIESKCENKVSTLVNIETKEELQFLKDMLSQRMFVSNEADNSTKSDILFIHLGHRWSNNKLVKTKFKSDIRREIGNERVQDDCLVLKFHNQSELNSQSAQKFLYSVESFPCGQYLPSIEMCEVNLLGDWVNDIEYDMNYFDSQSREIDKAFLFDCQEGEQNIHYNEVCDSVVNCKYARDEKYCFYDHLSQRGKGFNCIVKRFGVAVDGVIPEEYICNGQEDCVDGSDEMECDTCDEMKCSDGTCLPKHWFDPGNNQCNFSLINVVNSVEVNPYDIRCSDEDCVYPIQLTLGVTICNNVTNQWAPRCVYLKSKSGWPMGCNDLSHLENCENFNCPDDLVKCPFSYCILLQYLNDFIMDCMYGEDESNAVSISDDGLKQCLKKNPSISICDGKTDCDNMADELNCHSYCPVGFKCLAGVVIVDDYNISEPFKQFSSFDGRSKKFLLSGVNLSRIFNAQFKKFNQLLEIHLSNCSISKDTFIDFKEMNEKTYLVDLSYNNIGKISKHGMFSKLLNLKIINISHNLFLETIDSEGIVTNKILYFDLSYTNINFLPESLLRNLIIYNLFLQNTKIYSLTWFPLNLQVNYLNLQNTHLSNDNVKVKYFRNATISEKLIVDHFSFCCPVVTGPGIPSHVCQSPSDSISSCDGLIGDMTKKVLIWIMAILSTVGNTFTVTHLYLCDKFCFKPFYLFLINICVADFLMGIYLITVGSIDIFYHDSYILYEIDWRYSPLCKFCGFLSTLSNEVSLYFVSLITFERFLALTSCNGHTFKTFTLIISIVFPWTCGFCISLFPIIYDDWNIYSSNGMCRSLPFIGKEFGWMYLLITLVVLKLLFCTFIFVQVAFCIARAIMKVTSYNIPNADKEMYIRRHIFIIIFVKFMYWFPISFIGVLSIRDNVVDEKMYSWMILFFLSLSSAINPMVYDIPVIYKIWTKFKKG